MRPLLDIILVGYGRAGQIHARTFQGQTETCRLVGIVETDPARQAEAEEQCTGVEVFEGLEQALERVGHDVVVDLCVPAPLNLEISTIAVAKGVQRFMVEKPLGWSLAMSIELAELLRGKDVVYLDSYQYSKGVDTLQDWLVREQVGIEKLTIKFHKNRMPDSQQGRGFYNSSPPDAWHIEGPHMVSIALKLAGDIDKIESASLFDMDHGGIPYCNHGGGQARFRHSNGAITDLAVDLCSNENERLVEVVLTNGTLFKLFLPASKTPKLTSRLEKIVGNQVIRLAALEDRPVEQCLKSVIAYYLTEDATVCTVDHGLLISKALHDLITVAKRPRCCVSNS